MASWLQCHSVCVRLRPRTLSPSRTDRSSKRRIKGREADRYLGQTTLAAQNGFHWQGLALVGSRRVVAARFALSVCYFDFWIPTVPVLSCEVPKPCFDCPKYFAGGIHALKYSLHARTQEKMPQDASKRLISATQMSPVTESQLASGSDGIVDHQPSAANTTFAAVRFEHKEYNASARATSSRRSSRN